MLDHVSLGSRGFEEAIQFYSECFAPLAIRYRIVRQRRQHLVRTGIGSSGFIRFHPVKRLWVHGATSP